MANDKTFMQWRRDIMKIAWAIIITTLVCEIVYVICNDLSKEQLLFHILVKILLPIIACVMVCLFGQIILDRSNKDVVKNYTCVFSIGIVSAFCILFNYSVIPLIWGMSIPIFLSTIFSNKKMMFWLFIFSYIVLIISLILFACTKNVNDHIFDYFISSVLLGFSYVTAIVIAKFQNFKALQLMEAYNVSNELKEQLKLDQLTGLYNHTNIHKIVSELIQENHHLIMAMIDIDNFKQVNDNYGHVSGDRVIEKLAEIIRNHTNENIIGARYGGEEFVVIFKDIKMENAKEIVLKMGEELISYNFGFKVTFSCGLSHYADDKWNAKDFFSAADVVMYKAKSKGKNQICINESKNVKEI